MADMFSQLKGKIQDWIPLKKSGFLSNVVVLMSGTAVSQALVILASPLITRIYSPADYGAWSLILGFYMITSVIISWRYEFAIVLPEKDEEAINVFVISFVVSIIMTFISTFVIGFFGLQIATLIGVRNYQQWLWSIPLLLLLFGIYQICYFWYTRSKNFKRLAISKICQSSGTLATQIGTGVFWGGSPVGLILGRIIGQLIGTSILVINILKPEILELIKSLSWSSFKDSFAKYKNFPLYVAPYAFLAIFHKRSLYLLLGIFASTKVVGWFGLAMQIMYLPIGLVSASMNQVFYQKAAEVKSVKILEPFVLKTLTTMVLSATPVLVLVIFTSEWAFGFVFGEQWIQAGSYAIFISLQAFMLLHTSWLDRIYYVLGRQRLALILELFYNFISLGAFTIILSILKKPLWAVGLFCLITAIYNIFWLVVTFHIAGLAKRGLLRIGLIFLIVFCAFGSVSLLLSWFVQGIYYVIINCFVTTLFFSMLVAKYKKNRKNDYERNRKVQGILAG